MPRAKEYERETALQKAMEVFWVKGYEAASVGDLVEATGLNRFSLYNEFGNKPLLYTEAFKKYEQTVMDDRMRALEDSADGIEALRTFFSAYISGVAEALASGDEPTSCLSQLNAGAAIGKEPSAADTMRTILDRMTVGFEAVLQRAAELGEIRVRADYSAAALMLVGCTYGLDTLAKYLNRDDLEAYVSQVLSSLE